MTILFIRPLLSTHVFIGMLLMPPVALKLGSTGWRFLRYYGDEREYVEKGPPLLPLRLLAPVVVVAGAILAVATVRYAHPWIHWHGHGQAARQVLSRSSGKPAGMTS